MEINRIYQGDCMELMKNIPKHSVDMILCDLPYGITDAAWDRPLPLEKLWGIYKEVIKEKGAIVLFGCHPFTSELVMSNKRGYSHCWIWEKNISTNFLHASRFPLRIHEDIIVFYTRAGRDNTGYYQEERAYMWEELRKSGLTRKQIDKLLGNQMSSHYFTHGAQFSIPSEKDWAKLQATGYFQRPYNELKRAYMKGRYERVYNPQFTKGKPYVSKNPARKDSLYGAYSACVTVSEGKRYPVSILKFPCERGFHPT